MMRYAYVLVLIFCCFYSADGQSNPLERKITANYNHLPLSFVLKDLQKRYHIYFYYTNNLPALGSLVTVTASHRPLKYILEILLAGTQITYEVIQNGIVLKKTPLLPTGSNLQSTIGASASLNQRTTHRNASLEDAGFTLPQSVPGRVAFDSVINPVTHTYDRITAADISTLNLEYARHKEALQVYYQVFQDSLSHTDNSKGKLKAELLGWLEKMQQDINRLSDTLKLYQLQKLKEKLQTVDSSGYTYNPFQLSWVGITGRERLMNHTYVNNVSINVVAGSAGGLEGAEFGGLINKETDYVRGVQFAGIANVVGKDVTGSQFAGIANVNGGITNAVQFAGIANIVTDSVQGVQVGGITNIASGNMHGTQVAGILNVSKGRTTGLQLSGLLNTATDTIAAVQASGLINIARRQITGVQAAGLINVAGEDVRGTQISGLLNVAKRIKGSQIGIINIADTVDGIQLGLLSISKHSIFTLDASLSENLSPQVSLKLGYKRFYNIFSVSVYKYKAPLVWGLGYGLGTEFKLGQLSNLNIEALCYKVNINQVWSSNYLSILTQIKTTFSYYVHSRFAVYGGPVLNLFVRDNYQEQGTGLSAIHPKRTAYQYRGLNTQIIGWVGLQAGLRWKING